MVLVELHEVQKQLEASTYVLPLGLVIYAPVNRELKTSNVFSKLIAMKSGNGWPVVVTKLSNTPISAALIITDTAKRSNKMNHIIMTLIVDNVYFFNSL